MNITEILIHATFSSPEKSVCNVSRKDIIQWQTKLDPKTTAWLSIGEPGIDKSLIKNPSLSNLDFLFIQFWDVEKEIISLDDIYLPATDEQIKTMLEFLLRNQGKNILVNCAAGVSRSGAVAKFCNENFNHYWISNGKLKAIPNNYIYNKLCDFLYED